MISQRQSTRATPEEPQAPPIAEAQILPKQLDKPIVARPSKAHLLSGTPDKPQVVEAGPLDLYGCQAKAIKLLAGLCINIIEWLTVDLTHLMQDMKVLCSLEYSCP